MCLMADGQKPGGPTAKLCPSEEPKEAMADRGPNGRMVPTRTWRTQTPSIRDVMDLPYGRNFTLRFWKHAE